MKFKQPVCEDYREIEVGRFRERGIFIRGFLQRMDTIPCLPPG